MRVSNRFFMEHPLRSSLKNMNLAPNSTSFLESSYLELLQLDVFSSEFIEWS